MPTVLALLKSGRREEPSASHNLRSQGTPTFASRSAQNPFLRDYLAAATLLAAEITAFLNAPSTVTAKL
jgi:hypothetical protein